VKLSNFETFTAAICLKEPFPALFCSLPALNPAGSRVRMEKPFITLFDFAPDEACRIPVD